MKTANQIVKSAFELAESVYDIPLEIFYSNQIVGGENLTRKSGIGEEFWQHRDYEPYDSASLIDWRKSAKSEGLFVREYEKLASKTHYLWLDCSKSMLTESAIKFERCAELLIASALYFTKHGINCNILGNNESLSKRDMPYFLAEYFIKNLKTAGKFSSFPSANLVAASIKEREYLIMAGDFFTPQNDFEQNIKAIAAHGVSGKILMLHTVSESSWSYSGNLEFTDPENAESLEVNDANKIKDLYDENYHNWCKHVENICKQNSFTLYKSTTAENPTELIRNFIAVASGQ